VQGHRHVQLLGERQQGVVGRIAQRQAGVLGAQLTDDLQLAGGVQAAQLAQGRQRRVLGATNAGTDEDAAGVALLPGHGRAEPVARAAADDAARDVEPLHLGQAGREVLGAVAHGQHLAGDGVLQRLVQRHVRRVGVQVHVDDGLGGIGGPGLAGALQGQQAGGAGAQLQEIAA